MIGKAFSSPQYFCTGWILSIIPADTYKWGYQGDNSTSQLWRSVSWIMFLIHVHLTKDLRIDLSLSGHTVSSSKWMYAGTPWAFGFALHIMEMLLKSCWAISCKEIPNYEKTFPKRFSVFWKMLWCLWGVWT